MLLNRRSATWTDPFVFSINLLAFYHECRSLIGYAFAHHSEHEKRHLMQALVYTK